MGIIKTPNIILVLKLWGATVVLGSFVAAIVLYLKDIYSGTYSDAWDNPFYCFILYLFLGGLFSIPSLIIFTLLDSAILKINFRLRFLLAYFLGLICTLAPFYSFWGGLNVEHRTNLIISAICFAAVYTISFFIFKRMKALSV